MIGREDYQRGYSMDNPASGFLALTRCSHARQITDRPRTTGRGAGMGQPRSAAVTVSAVDQQSGAQHE